MVLPELFFVKFLKMFLLGIFMEGETEAYNEVLAREVDAVMGRHDLKDWEALDVLEKIRVSPYEMDEEEAVAFYRLEQERARMAGVALDGITGGLDSAVLYDSVSSEENSNGELRVCDPAKSLALEEGEISSEVWLMEKKFADPYNPRV